MKTVPFPAGSPWIAEKAERMLVERGVADTSYWGPEYEFYIFPKVEYDTRVSASYYHIYPGEEFHHNAYHASIRRTSMMTSAILPPKCSCNWASM